MDSWEDRRQTSLLQREGESERDWALRLIGEVNNEHRWAIHWIGEYMRLGRLTDKLQRVISKLRRRALSSPPSETPAPIEADGGEG